MNTPRFSRKETRQLAKELEQAGFIYDSDDTKGHALYVYSDGQTVSLSETPGHGQIARIRDDIRRITGTGKTGGFDRAKQRNKTAAEKRRTHLEQIRRNQQRVSIEEAKSRIAAKEADQRRLAARYRELQSIQSLMGARGSCF